MNIYVSDVGLLISSYRLPKAPGSALCVPTSKVNILTGRMTVKAVSLVAVKINHTNGSWGRRAGAGNRADGRQVGETAH